MATHDYVIANQSGAAFRTDLNNTLAAIVSNNSNSLFTTAGGVDVDAASNFNEDVVFTGASHSVTFDKSANSFIFNDNAKAVFGTGSDFQIKHTGSNSQLIHSGTGDLFLDSIGGDVFLRAGDNAGGVHPSVECDLNAGVKLFFDNTKRFETTSSGVDVTGNLQATGNLQVNDNGHVYVGNGGDLDLFHNGTNSFIDSDTGNLVISSVADMRFNAADYKFMNAADNETLAIFNQNGAVKLYHDNTQRFETVSNGFRLVHSTGNVQFHFNRIIANLDQTFFIDHTATGRDFQIRTSDSSGLDTVAVQILGSGCLYNRCRSSSQASLTLRKQVTGANGIDYLQCRNQNNDLRMVVEGDGDVKNTNNSYGSTSDLKLKENIVDASSQWNDIKAIKVRNFNFIEDSEKTKMLGVVAQEIETSSPNLVYESIDRDP